MKLVLGADVLIGALDGSDSHHVQARELFTNWREQQATRLMSVVNLSEMLVAPGSDPEPLAYVATTRSAFLTLIAWPPPGTPVGRWRLSTARCCTQPR